MTWDVTVYYKYCWCVVWKRHLRWIQLKWIPVVTLPSLSDASVACKPLDWVCLCKQFKAVDCVSGKLLPRHKGEIGMFSIYKTCGSYCLTEIGLCLYFILFLKWVFHSEIKCVHYRKCWKDRGKKIIWNSTKAKTDFRCSLTRYPASRECITSGNRH